ncbi:helix-turn-helix domain-containing protein [Pseudonocardia spinosispora]|uniref:helix-turn-helix domain-containing protein n=1 Tax=Pseudonocardia spinosispora TaxID=103441 RepID=UPI0006849BEC|nr:helix-turn-helix transcriptional regulator [Pseudonocardia spinosispora]
MAFELRKIREDAGISRSQVAQRLHCVVSHVSHVETMRNLPRAAEIEVMLDFYGAADRTEFFIDMLTAARKGKDWWAAYQDAVPKEFDLFLGLENIATRIDSYAAMVVPGLLQLPSYAEAVIRDDGPDLSDEEVVERISLRSARQQILEREDPQVRVRTVLDESVLRRAVGGAEVAAEQLTYLAELADRPNVEIQVLPVSLGAHPGIGGSFQLLSFPPNMPGDQGVSYVENTMQAIYYEAAEEVAAYRDVFIRLQERALSSAESRAALQSAVREFSGGAAGRGGGVESR